MMEGDAFIDGEACEHRYHLWRAWKTGARSVTWVMLNPSTADARRDDPTIRKCIGFAQRWGFGSIDVINLYSFRTPSPAALRTAGYPNGPHADSTIHRVLLEYTELVVYAWGTKAQPERVAEVDAMVRAAGHLPWVLRRTKDAHPEHPLYIPYATERCR